MNWYHVARVAVSTAYSLFSIFVVAALTIAMWCIRMVHHINLYFVAVITVAAVVTIFFLVKEMKREYKSLFNHAPQPG